MSTTKVIAEVDVEEKPKTLSELIRSKKLQYEQLLPPHIPAARFLRIIFTQMQKSPDLLQCTQDSVLSAILTAAEIGLVPDGRKGALVPFNKSIGNNKWIKQAQFIPMYQGLIELARNSGQIADIFAATVYENDEYNYELGLSRDLTHRPLILGDRGHAIAYYCVVELTSGAKTFGSGPMTVAEVKKIQERARAKKGPWVTDFDAMAWKTVIKRVLKYCPQSSDLARAIEIDNDFSLDDDVIDIDAIEGQIADTDELNETIGKIAEKKKKALPKTKSKKPEKSAKPLVASEPAEEAQTDSDPNKVTLTRVARMLKLAKNDDDIDIVLDLSNGIENTAHKQQAVDMAIARAAELAEGE